MQKERPSKRAKLIEYTSRDEGPSLEDVRRRNELKLRRTFEAIFDKYSRDFTGVADEMDIETGEIVVDNGHVRGMRHERDILTKKDCVLTNRTASRDIEEDDGGDDELSTPLAPVSDVLRVRVCILIR